MKFGFFHTMPWTLHEKPLPWPADAGEFDAAAAEKLYRSYLDCIASAEEFGFDWLCCNEHHFSPYGLMANCNLMGAALAHRTTSSRLAMVGNLVPMLNPIRVAEEYAMLDVMSGGRLIAGFMRGVPHEYLAYNINPSESCELAARSDRTHHASLDRTASICLGRRAFSVSRSIAVAEALPKATSQDIVVGNQRGVCGFRCRTPRHDGYGVHKRSIGAEAKHRSLPSRGAAAWLATDTGRHSHRSSDLHSGDR